MCFPTRTPAPPPGARSTRPVRGIRVATPVALWLLIIPSTGAAPQPAVPRLPPVTTASRTGADGTRSVQVIDRAMLDRLPGTSVQAALQWALGSDLQPRSPAQADHALRGATYEQTLVLVDGQRMRDLQTGHFALDLAVPYEAIERIEIVRGAAAAQYGADAVGGVVNIVTRGRGAAGRLRGGRFGTVDAALSAGGTVAGARAAVHGERLRTSGHRPGTDADVTQLRATLARGDGARRWRADAGYGARDFGAAAFYAPFDSYERTRTATLSLTADALWRDRVAWTARTGVRHHSDDFILVRTDPARYRNRHRSLQAEGELSARWAPTPATTVAVGGEWLSAWLRSARLGDRAQQRGALYGEVRHRQGPAEGSLGARLDGSSDFGRQLVPTAALAVTVAPSVVLRGSAAGGWRQPTWTDRFYQDPANRGTPTLRPEQFVNQEIGVAVGGVGGVTLDVALFDRRGRETIDWVRPLGVLPRPAWVATNIGRTRTTGVEAIMNTTFGSMMSFSWRGSALRVSASQPPGVEGKYALRPLTRSGGVTLQLNPAGRVWLLTDLLHARRAGERAYTTIGLRVGTLWRGATWSLEGTNLGRARALDASGVPMAGAAYALGVQWRGRGGHAGGGGQ